MFPDTETEACFCFRVTLNKRSQLSLFGNDISPVVVDVEFQTKDRLRFKVSILGGGKSFKESHAH